MKRFHLISWKNSLIPLLALFFSLGNSQQTKTLDHDYSVVYWKTSGSYFRGGTYEIGRETNGSYSSVYRTVFTSSFGIPPSVINNAWIKLWISSYDTAANSTWTAEITNASGIELDEDAGTIWQGIGNGASVFSGLEYRQMQGNQMTNSNFLALVQSAYNQGKNIQIGIRASQEASFQSRAHVNAEIILQYTPIWSVTIENSFHAGEVKVDGSNYSSGANFPWQDQSNHTLEAINRPYIQDATNQKYYYRIYKKWNKNGSQIGTSNPMTVGINSDAMYSGVFNKEFNLSFQNSYGGGNLKVNGVQYGSPTQSFPVEEYQSISAEVTNTSFVQDAVTFTFSSWSNGSTQSSTTFYPTDHTTYIANFDPKPMFPENVVGGINGNHNPVINWSEHQSSSVTQYRVYVQYTNKGEQPATWLAGTLNRGTTTFTDYNVRTSDSYTGKFYSYAVVALYTGGGTSIESDKFFAVVYNGSTIEPRRYGDPDQMELAQIPQKFGTSVYPNPFNPTTKIAYQLPEASVITLEIFDVMGRKVSSLVSGSKAAGFHFAIWEGKDQSGNHVASGLYLYRFTAVSSNGRPIIQSGKILFTK